MGITLPQDIAGAFDELSRAARDVYAIRREQNGPLDVDDALDEAIARLLHQVEQLEADTT
jgi:hypothetical protein